MTASASIAQVRERDSQHVLVVEDERSLASEIAESLKRDGWTVQCVHDGADGLRLAQAITFDVVILDRRLPGLDGLEVLKALRKARRQTPVLFVTAVGGVSDRVEGLEYGGDDYLVKPFSIAELKARVQALARRSSISSSAADDRHLVAGGMTLDRVARSTWVDDQRVELLPLEFKLLEHLALNAGQLVTRAMLLEQVWGFHFDPRTNIVETHISRLRRKIDTVGAISRIATVRGGGYRLVV